MTSAGKDNDPTLSPRNETEDSKDDWLSQSKFKANSPMVARLLRESMLTERVTMAEETRARLPDPPTSLPMGYNSLVA
jgi:hypothetical protein